ncbi:hypothetical protein [Pseudoduganella albidiflava]|uniref:MFS transporter n=1 Tax=Pseudoduganella albidiflava TaxID=321983 RepID=A0A411X4G3_9BURK|nr:hypothetical protein [Pseudoduganella albidiflava]QBI03735.1 hypothetical protein EYF70_25125 [Pseudoduganella albidiflava]GGY62078.1 hypothetical protein GCM10007387_50830 [Pseudoduganella albidiflava]
MPRLSLAAALLVLAALAGTMTYTGFLIIGVLADYLGIGRVMTGLLLGVLFARFPAIRNGKLRMAGLLPKPARRPVMVGLLALCLSTLVWRGEYVPALFTGFTTAFLLAYPWIWRAISGRVLAFLPKFMSGQRPSGDTGGTVVDVEMRERKD